MAEAHAKDEWSRMSVLLAVLANCHRDPKKTRAFKPADFDPFAKRPVPATINMEDLRAMFLEGRYGDSPAARRFPRTQETPRTEDRSCGSAA